MLEGHNFDGAPLPDVPTVPMIMGSGGLYSTPDDMLRWIAWHLDRSWHPDVEMRLLDHAAYVYRDGLDPVFGLDESGPMDALGLGWIIMMPRGDHPSRGIGAFAAINQFSFGAATTMAKAVNALIGTLAPR